MMGKPPLAKKKKGCSNQQASLQAGFFTKKNSTDSRVKEVNLEIVYNNLDQWIEELDPEEIVTNVSVNTLIKKWEQLPEKIKNYPDAECLSKWNLSAKLAQSVLSKTRVISRTDFEKKLNCAAVYLNELEAIKSGKYYLASSYPGKVIFGLHVSF